MALDKLVDSSQLDADLTSVANAIRAKSGGSGSLAFPSGFVSEVQAIPTGVTPTGTKQISITQNGTTTEDVTNYADAEITVNVPSGLKLLGSGAWVKTGNTANNAIPISYSDGTPMLYWAYNDTVLDATEQVVFGGCYNLTSAEMGSYSSKKMFMYIRRASNNNYYPTGSNFNAAPSLTTTTMRLNNTGQGYKAGTWHWFIYGV